MSSPDPRAAEPPSPPCPVGTTAPVGAIVKMTRAHIDELMPYEREMFGTEAWSASSYRTELADIAHRYYRAVESTSGELLGWGGVMVIGQSADILTVGVIPRARRQGIAVRLLAALLDQAKVHGANEVFLEVRVDNGPARRLYEREGFVQVGTRRGYYDNGRIDAVTMRREL